MFFHNLLRVVLYWSFNFLSRNFKLLLIISLGDKFLQILNIIFNIIGNNQININNINNTNSNQFNKLIELIPLLRLAILNIINISKEYEKTVCNSPTNTTIKLEQLYNELFSQEKNIDINNNFEFNLKSIFKENDDHITFGKKIIIIIVFTFVIIQIGKLLISIITTLFSRGVPIKSE